MKAESFRRWLYLYGRAWMSRDPKAATVLYTEAATYQVTPFTGRYAGATQFMRIGKMSQTQKEIPFDHEIVAVTPEKGLARRRASFIIEPFGLKTKSDGFFLCSSLREWWHTAAADRSPLSSVKFVN